MKGLVTGLQTAREKFSIDGNLIMCFLRDLSEEDAIKVFEQSLKYK